MEYSASHPFRRGVNTRHIRRMGSESTTNPLPHGHERDSAPAVRVCALATADCRKARAAGPFPLILVAYHLRYLRGATKNSMMEPGAHLRTGGLISVEGKYSSIGTVPPEQTPDERVEVATTDRGGFVSGTL